MNNIFSPNMDNPSQEQFDTLLKIGCVHIEKITSNGQITDGWYEQDRDEWVVLIEGEGKLLFDNGDEITLHKGEHIYIPRMQKHKVVYTSSPAIWLAIHFL